MDHEDLKQVQSIILAANAAIAELQEQVKSMQKELTELRRELPILRLRELVN
jgi:restriction endonuclease S subunit